MSFPSGRQRMSKRPAAQKRSAVVDWSASDDDFDGTERSAKASNRRGRKAAVVKEDPELSADAAERDEEQPGPSRRGPRKGRGRSGVQDDPSEGSEQPARGRAGASTAARKKAAARAPRQDDNEVEAEAADFLMIGLSGDEAEAPESADDELLQAALDRYEYEATPASAADSQGVSAGEEASLVRAVMRFLIFRQQQRPGVPVRREELTKIVLREYKGQRVTKLSSRILALAAARFPRAFGMELKEVTLKTHTKHGEVDGAKVFVLRSLLPTKLRAFVQAPTVEMNQGFAMVVMPLIGLAGGKLSEGDLAAQLEKLGVSLDYDHPTLGKPSEQLLELVAKKYLVKSRDTTADGPSNVYAIGSFATEEIGEDSLKAFIEKVFARPSEAREP